MTKQYRKPVMASSDETAEGLHADSVMDRQTMRKFDGACLTCAAAFAGGNSHPA
jgi:hypothetical protein